MHLCFALEFMEYKKCYLFSGLGVVGCEDGVTQGDEDGERMDGPMQGCRRFGGAAAEAGGEGTTTTEDHLERAGFSGCSIDSKFGGAGTGRFIRFWHEKGC